MDLKDCVVSISILNLDKEQSTITPMQLLWNYDDNGRKSFIVSDVDPELLILIQFHNFVNLKCLKIQSLSNNNQNMSQPRDLHLYSMQNLNINFQDIRSFDADKSVKCSSKKLQKAQRIKVNQNLKNVLKFNRILYLVMFIESNQNNTQQTHLNGLKIEGRVHFPCELIHVHDAMMNHTAQKQLQLTDIMDYNSNPVIQSDSWHSTKVLIDGYLRLNETLCLIHYIPQEISILCLFYYHYTIDAIMNLNHLSSTYQQQKHLENVYGAFGSKYYIYKKQSNNKLYTVKMVHKAWNTLIYDTLAAKNGKELTNITRNLTNPDMYENEINILKDPRIKHRNLLNVIETCENKYELYIFYDYNDCDDGMDLSQKIIEIGGGLDEYSIKIILNQLLSVLLYLHGMSIVERFITLRNIWFKSRNSFDIVLMNNELMELVPKTGLKGIIGNHYYIAPEMILKQRYDTQVDMWSLGVVLYIMLCGAQPFHVARRDYNNRDTWLKALHGMIVNGEYEMQGPLWINVSVEAKDLVQKLLNVDKQKRFNAKQASAHIWLK